MIIVVPADQAEPSCRYRGIKIVLSPVDYSRIVSRLSLAGLHGTVGFCKILIKHHELSRAQGAKQN